MYSPPKARSHISRDGDPQMFEQLLLEYDEDLEDVLMLSDFIPSDFEEEKTLPSCPLFSIFTDTW